MSRVIAWIGAAFAAVGLVLAAIGGWFYFADRDLAAAGVRTQGTVIQMVSSRDTNGSYTSRPVVEFFDPAGTRHVFMSQVSSSPPNHSTGERVDVLYLPGSPENAVIDSFFERFFAPLVLGGMGALFAVVGGGMLFAWLRHRRIVAWLRSSGLPIQARFVQCYWDTSVRVNGRSPFRVVCQAIHPGTGQLQSFKSDPIWVDLTQQLAGRDVRVFVDPAKSKHYAVDLSTLVDESQMG